MNMLNDIPIFPIQIQHNNDDHSLTYSSADSSMSGGEDASVFSLDGMMFEQEESEEHFVGTDSSGTSSPSTSFVELEQSIHELEKCYAQCIKSSPQKGSDHGKRNKEDAVMMIEAEMLLKRKEVNQDNAIQVSNGDQPRLVFATAALDLDEELLVKQEKVLYKRQCLYQGGASKKRSTITDYSLDPVSRNEEGNATKEEGALKRISWSVTNSTRAPNKTAQSTMYRVSNGDFLDLEG